MTPQEQLEQSMDDLMIPEDDRAALREALATCLRDTGWKPDEVAGVRIRIIEDDPLAEAWDAE